MFVEWRSHLLNVAEIQNVSIIDEVPANQKNVVWVIEIHFRNTKTLSIQFVTKNDRAKAYHDIRKLLGTAQNKQVH